MTPTPGIATKSYRFVGIRAVIWNPDLMLTKFGEKLDLTDEQAQDVLRRAILILPAEQMASFFTDKEMQARDFPKFPGHWFGASDDLKARKKCAIAAAVELHYQAKKNWLARESAKEKEGN